MKTRTLIYTIAIASVMVPATINPSEANAKNLTSKNAYTNYTTSGKNNYFYYQLTDNKSNHSACRTEFDKKLKKFDKLTTRLMNENDRDYQRLAKEFNKMIAEYQALPENVKKYYSDDRDYILYGLYYNLACYNAKIGNQKIALAAMDEASKYSNESYKWERKLLCHNFEKATNNRDVVNIR